MLPKIEDTIKMNPRDFLQWIMDIGDTSERYAPLYVIRCCGETENLGDIKYVM